VDAVPSSAFREFTHVRDVATAFRLAVETAPDAGYALYNVGTGAGVSIREVIAAGAVTTGRDIPVAHLPPKPEPHTLISDPSKLARALGWHPVHSALSEILTSAAAAWR
jgi:UDP-glucose 4-epimerase